MSQVWWREKAERATRTVVRFLQPDWTPGGCLRPEVLEACEALGLRPYVGTNNRAVDSTKVQGAARQVWRQPTFVDTEDQEPYIDMPREKKSAR